MEERTIDAIEKIGLRVETIKLLSTAIQDTSQANRNETPAAKVERIYSILSVLDDELDLLNAEVNRAEEIEIAHNKERREVIA